MQEIKLTPAQLTRIVAEAQALGAGMHFERYQDALRFGDILAAAYEFLAAKKD
jgi:hypothetical protein